MGNIAHLSPGEPYYSAGLMQEASQGKPSAI